jgi:glycosyltransferase involved in cell wall biosynthesis
MEQLIYTTDHPEYRSGPTKFGICMATYQRKNGKSPMYLKRSLDAIINQTATNWHLYLVGDKYENNDEFLECISTFPKDKITAVNLPSALERENIKNITDLWKVGGATAFNHAHQLAVADGCEYILHHDDDDPFHTKKIQVLNYVLTLYHTPLCMFHYSTYIGSILPRQIVSTISPLLPSEGNVIHTSLCIHKSIASDFMYDGYSPEKTTYTCGDMQLIAYIRNAVKDSLKSIFVPLLLCSHDIEGEVKR